MVEVYHSCGNRYINYQSSLHEDIIIVVFALKEGWINVFDDHT